MELYNKELLKNLKNTVDDSGYYMPKALFSGSRFGNVRLETKLAYVALLDTLLKKPVYNQENLALAILANKEVNQDKVVRYIDELIEANLIEINKKDIYIYHLD